MPDMKINKKYRLTTTLNGSHHPNVATQWATGRRNPCNRMAMTDAPSVFFYVATNAKERHIMAWCIHSGHSIAGHEQVSHHSAMSMVAQAGQLSGWPVLVLAGTPTPAWAIAISERRNSGDSIICYRTEAAIMATTPVPPPPQFVWLFLAVRRSDVSAKPHREEITAPDFMSARRTIARDFIVSFAGRLPTREVAHV